MAFNLISASLIYNQAITYNQTLPLNETLRLYQVNSFIFSITELILILIELICLIYSIITLCFQCTYNIIYIKISITLLIIQIYIIFFSINVINYSVNQLLIDDNLKNMSLSIIIINSMNILSLFERHIISNTKIQQYFTIQFFPGFNIKFSPFRQIGIPFVLNLKLDNDINNNVI